MDLGLSGEMIFLAFLALLLFGPRKLPEIAKTVGRFMAELKRASSEFQGRFNQELQTLGGADQTKNLLTSLADDFKALDSIRQPGKAIMALADAQLKEPLGAVSLLDNVNRINEFLTKNPEAAKAPDGEKPPETVPDHNVAQVGTNGTDPQTAAPKG